LLRKLLEANESWTGFVARLGQTKLKLKRTPLASCIKPSLRPKARFMNLAAPLRWARWCLRVLDDPWPTGGKFSDRQRTVLATLNRTSLEEKLGWLSDYRRAIERWCQWHEANQMVVRHVRRSGIAENSMEELQCQFEAMELSLFGRDVADAMIAFVAEQTSACWPDGKRLVGSTEILESIFGEPKPLERQQSESWVTGLMLVVGMLISRSSNEEIEKDLEATPWKAVEAWIDEHIGLMVQSRCAVAGKLFAEP
jgi:hypothetical protein